ncbi:MAG: flagellar protein FlaG [Campylobacter sp.]|nr:flagellar protein FlaG [Campylobacter sp.]
MEISNNMAMPNVNIAPSSSFSAQDTSVKVAPQPQSGNTANTRSEFEGLSQEELINKVSKITDELNSQMLRLETNIRFDYDSDANIMVVKVTEANTGNVISELPSEQALRISKYFRESIGLLFDKES